MARRNPRHQPKQRRVILDLFGNFPSELFPAMWPNQEAALNTIRDVGGSALLELPPGSGKTPIGVTVLRAMKERGMGPLFYVTPTKTLVNQIRDLYPDVSAVYGRNEYPCFYYEGSYKADEVPCSMLKDCPHRVNQQTGSTFEPGVEPCPYLQAKYEAKNRGGIVVCTTSFYLYTQLFSKEWDIAAGLVIDEVHRLANTVRFSLSYEISDYHLRRCIGLLRNIKARKEANQLERFLDTMTGVIKSRPRSSSTILEEDEIRLLVGCLRRIRSFELQEKVQAAVTDGRIDPLSERDTLRNLEVITHDIQRYLVALSLALPSKERKPLTYVFSCYYEEDRKPRRKVRYKLFIKSYYVAPLISKILSPFTVSYSATIGKPDKLGFETGIRSPFFSFPSTFPAKNTRIFVPSNTPNLANKVKSRQEPARVMRKVARACRRFADNGLRSLVVVVSNEHLRRFERISKEEGVDVVTYGNGTSPKSAAERFKKGEGDTLLGTAANFAEGIDLPKGISPVTFFLKPGYSNPESPEAQFERKRFSESMCWSLWRWRVIIQALQVRGRNIRSRKDKGVTFFISQQFRDFLYGSLPEYLKESYVGDKSFEECIKESEKLLGVT